MATLQQELSTTMTHYHSHPQEEEHNGHYASDMTLLLSNYEKYGLTERVFYHLELLHLFSNDEEEDAYFHDDDASTSSPYISCGVLGLLDCQLPSSLPMRTKVRKRFHRQIQDLNLQAFHIHSHSVNNNNCTQPVSLWCFKPKSLPMPMGPSNTSLTFAYDTVSMVLCITATPSMTTTFTGSSSSALSEYTNHSLFPLDRLGDTCRHYFQALLEPMDGATLDGISTTTPPLPWSPRISLTVMAILPSSNTDPLNVMVLVRDYKLIDPSSAQYLADRITEWACTDVENQIASSMYKRKAGHGSLEVSSILNVATTALQSLPLSGRPCIVLATDGRLLPCPTVLEYVQNTQWNDIPLFVLDLSEDNNDTFSSSFNFSDDREALFELCKVSRGCFMDRRILTEGARVRAGNVAPNSIFNKDDGFCQPRTRKIRPNAIQWYTLFQPSPCCTCQSDIPWQSSSLPIPRFLQRPSITERRSGGSGATVSVTPVLILSYTLSNIRVKEVILMRIQDGFIPRRYSKDRDKVSILLSLKLENDCSILYDMTSKRRTVSVKLSLVAASPDIITLVKVTLTSLHPYSQRAHHPSVAQTVSYRISSFLLLLRDDDTLRSHLYLQEWTESYLSCVPLLQRLKALDRRLANRHFQLEQLDVLLREDDDSLGYVNCSSTSSSTNDSLIRWLDSWASKIIRENDLYIKILPPTDQHGSVSYFLVRVRPSSASRLVTLDLLFCRDIGVARRNRIISEVKDTVSTCESLIILRPIRHLLATRPTNTDKNSSFQRLLYYDSWSLPKDSDLFYLVTKRRVSVEKYWVLDDRNSSKLFGKSVWDDSNESKMNTYFVQYLIEIMPDELIVHLFIERKEGVFVNLSHVERERNEDDLCLAISSEVRNRDIDCTSYLISRKNLLSVFEPVQEIDQMKTLKTDLERLVQCSTQKICLNLRFFQHADIVNRILAERTEDLLQAGLFNSPIKRLILDDNIPVADFTQGTWFLVRNDWNALTLIHFSSEDNVSSDNTVHRKLTFLTSYIHLLDHENLVDNLGDPLTPEIIEFISNTHNRNIARSAYEALRTSLGQIDLHPRDLQFVLGMCTEIKVLNSFYFSAFSQKIIESEQQDSNLQSDSETAGSKFLKQLGEIMRPIADGGGVYYYIGEESEDFVNNILLSIAKGHGEESTQSQSSYSQSSIDSNESICREIIVDSDSSASDDSVLGDSDISSQAVSLKSCGCILPPVFISFASDGRRFSIEELLQLGRRSCELDAFISVFSDSKQLFNISQHQLISDFRQVELRPSLPRLHSAVAIQLETRLRSVVAEQTLERLHYYCESLSETEVKIIKKCFVDAKSVVMNQVPIYLFSVGADNIIDASTSSPFISDFEQGFTLLTSYLEFQMGLRRFKNGVFITTTPNGAWCYVKVPDMMGPILVQVFCSKGASESEIIVNQITLTLKKCEFRANQELLLRSLHLTRNANDLLFTTKINDMQIVNTELHLEKYGQFPFGPNFFHCPIVFETSFLLNHRCPITQVIMSLESTILHNFAVSNRPGKFVYKDEEDRVFYLSLEPKKNDSNILTLLVYGIHNAGPAITSHLTKLVGKKLLSMGVDALSTLLMKNPHFNLLPVDITFLRSFQSVWRRLEADEINSMVDRNEVTYQLPAACYDPILLLMFFRQNISGSTFFHIRNDPPSDDDANAIVGHDILQDEYQADRGAPFYFQEKDFALYFNASPAQLDPTFQPVTTLTEAGMRFSRLCGVGVALIDVKLLRYSDPQSNKYFIGRMPIEDDSCLIPNFDSLKLKRIADAHDIEKDSYGVVVSIVNTTLDVQVLHRWIELSLTQALNGWVIERHIEKARLGFLAGRKRSRPHSHDILQDHKYHEVNDRCPGLPLLGCILHLTHQLPNPTVKRCDFYGQLKATSLIGITVNLLENCLLPSLLNDRKCSLSEVKNVTIIRISENKYSSIQVRRDPIREKILMYDSATDERLCDNHYDTPEYICSFDLLPSRGLGKMSTPPATSFLFQNVFIEDYLTSDQRGSLSHALQILKSKNPSAFLRRITFILTVTRSTRSVLFYNWNPQHFQSAVGKMQDVHNQFTHDEKESHIMQQQRCIRHIHFQKVESLIKPQDNPAIQNDPVRERSEPTQTSNVSSSSATTLGRAQRLSILKPTLVGKSVEGAAMQAMVLSRAKASAKPIPSSKAKTATTNAATTDAKVSGNKKESPSSVPLLRSHIDRMQPNLVKDANNSILQGSTVKDLLDRIPLVVVQSVSWLKVAADGGYRIFNPSISLRILQSLYFFILTDETNRSVLYSIWDVISPVCAIIGTKSFPLLQSSTTCSTDSLLDFFAKSITREAQARLVSAHAAENDATTILLFTSLISPIHVLVYELSIHSKQFCRLRTYLFTNQINRSKGDPDPSAVALRKRLNINTSKILRLSTTTSQKTNFYSGRMSPESHPLNFAATLLKAAAHGHALQSLDVPEILREMMLSFKEGLPRPIGVHYTLLHRTGEYPSLSHFSMSELVHRICQQPLLYNSQNCSSSDPCISIMVPAATTIASIAFMMPLKDTMEGYDLFVLCCIHGIDMNSYVRDGSTTPWAQKLSDCLLQKANHLLHQTLDMAMNSLWKDRLWNKYMVVPQSYDTNEATGDIVALRSLSHVVSVSKVDERFASLLFGQDSHIQFNFHDLETAMKSDAMFSRWTEISPRRGWICHVIYFENEYLLLHREEGGCLRECEVLLKNLHDDPMPVISSFGNFVLLWVYNHADVL